jgi:hypothetical protein
MPANANGIKELNSAMAPLGDFRGGKAKGPAAPKVLVVEVRNSGLRHYPWNSTSRQRFQLNWNDIRELEHNAVLLRGSTAFIVDG